MATATNTIANNAPNHAANHPTPHAAPRGGHNAPAPVAPPTSAYPSDDEILGIVDEPNSGEKPRDRSFGANVASREARGANTAPQNEVDISDAAQNSNAPGAAMPEWLARVSAADPAAAPELAALWNRSSALETFDRAVYGGDPSARQQLVTQLYSDDPAALRALVATATQLLDGNVAQVVPSDLGPLSDTGRDSLLSSPANSPFGSRDTSPSALHSAARASNIPRSDEPTWATKPPHDPAPAEPHFSPAAYAQFEQSTNDAVVADVGRAIERALDRTLPQGIADGARRRIAGDTLAEVHAALRGDRQLASQVAAALRGSRFDNATREQIARLITSRARGVVPEAARRVIGEWTGSVLASHRERTARQQANTARVDVIGGASPQAVPRRAVKSGDIDYRATSDEDILSW